MTSLHKILSRAKKVSSRFTVYAISARAAGQLVHEAYGPHKRAPRPGYEVVLPSTILVTDSGEHPGHWNISNRAGKYELMFYYED